MIYGCIMKRYISFFESDDSYDDLRQALVALNDRDSDHATDLNGVGYNGMDGMFARSLLDHSRWSYKQAAAAYKMIRKYKKQLRSYGIDYDSIPVPAEPIKPEVPLRISKEISSPIASFDETLPLFDMIKSHYDFKPLNDPIKIYGATVNFVTTPDSAFWTLWKERKEEIKSAGFVVSKDDSGKFCLYIKDLTTATKNKDTEEQIEKYQSTPSDQEVQMKITSGLLDWQIPFA